MNVHAFFVNFQIISNLITYITFRFFLYQWYFDMRADNFRYSFHRAIKACKKGLNFNFSTKHRAYFKNTLFYTNQENIDV